MRYRMSEEPNSRTVHLLLSYAVRYPEIATVRYDPRRMTLRLAFLVTGELSPADYERAEGKLLETLEVYHLLEQRRAQTVELYHEGLGGLNTIALERDVATLTPEEIFTVVEAMRELFPGRVLADPVEFFGEEEMMAQDEMIEQMLASLSKDRSAANLIAIREDGRLMFFHK
ncbi:MAG: hypothetical protein ACOY93_16325 [Bacillota bacterium]